METGCFLAWGGGECQSADIFLLLPPPAAAFDYKSAWAVPSPQVSPCRRHPPLLPLRLSSMFVRVPREHFASSLWDSCVPDVASRTYCLSGGGGGRGGCALGKEHMEAPGGDKGSWERHFRAPRFSTSASPELAPFSPCSLTFTLVLQCRTSSRAPRLCCAGDRAGVLEAASPGSGESSPGFGREIQSWISQRLRRQPRWWREGGGAMGGRGLPPPQCEGSARTQRASGPGRAPASPPDPSPGPHAPPLPDPTPVGSQPSGLPPSSPAGDCLSIPSILPAPLRTPRTISPI